MNALCFPAKVDYSLLLSIGQTHNLRLRNNCYVCITDGFSSNIQIPRKLVGFGRLFLRPGFHLSSSFDFYDILSFWKKSSEAGDGANHILDIYSIFKLKLEKMLSASNSVTSNRQRQKYKHTLVENKSISSTISAEL